jgi:hypothetical protein
MMVRIIRRRTGGSAICFGFFLAAALSGCNGPIEGPIEAYRSLSGLNKNDPDPALAPFNANLDQAQTGSYPNLASVPPPPSVASTVAERQKLAENLTGERSSAEAKDASGQPGTATSGPVPPPPPIPPSIAAPEMAALPPPTPQPETPIPPMRKMDEPPVPPPPDTAMETPQIGNVPGVAPPRPPAPQGHPSAIPPPAPSALPAAAVQSGNPLPPQPQATLAPPQVSPEVAALPPPKLPPTPMIVASLDASPGPAALGDDEQARLAQVVRQYQAKPRPVRVVAYAAPGVGGAEQLDAFRGALDRAQKIAKELADAGIPAKQIQTQAAPASANAPAGRVEIQLLQ